MGMGRLAAVIIAAVLGLSLAAVRLAGQTRSAASADPTAATGTVGTSQAADSRGATAPAEASSSPASEQAPVATSPAVPADQGRKLYDLPVFTRLGGGFTVSPDGIYAAIPISNDLASSQASDKVTQQSDIYLVDMSVPKYVPLSEKMPKPADSNTAGAATKPDDTTTRPNDSTDVATMQLFDPEFSADSKYMTFKTVSGDDHHISLWLMDLTSPSAFAKGPAEGKTISCLAQGKTLMASWVGKKIALGTTGALGYFQPIKFIDAATLATTEWPVRGYVATTDARNELLVCVCMVDNPRGPANTDELSKLNVVLMKPSGKIVRKLTTAGELSSSPIFSPGLKYLAYQRAKRKSTGRVTMDVGAIEVVALDGDYTRTITGMELALHVTDGGSVFSLGAGPAGTSGVVKVRDKSGKATVLFEAITAAVTNDTIYYIKAGESGAAIMSVPLPKVD
jgi:hypothetical protein